MTNIRRRPDTSHVPADSRYGVRLRVMWLSAIAAVAGLVAFALGLEIAGFVVVALYFAMLFVVHRPLETAGFNETRSWLLENWSSLDSDARAAAMREVRIRFGARYVSKRELEQELETRTVRQQQPPAQDVGTFTD